MQVFALPQLSVSRFTTKKYFCIIIYFNMLNIVVTSYLFCIQRSNFGLFWRLRPGHSLFLNKQPQKLKVNVI